MNRRRFLEFLGAATVGSTVAYSFPSIIVPKNIEITGFADAINKGMKFSGFIEEESWIEYCFDLIDTQLKTALQTIENPSFFGKPVTMEEIYASFNNQ